MAFTPDALNHLSNDTQRNLIAFWEDNNFTPERHDVNIDIAFAYYRILTSFVDKFKDSDYIDVASPELQEELKKVANLWTDTGEEAMFTTDEAVAFNNYFISVEIVLNKELQRVYFPVPRECREQIYNPVVQDQIEDMMVSINRDSPESKMTDFLERSGLIRDVISTQHLILTGNDFGFIVRFFVGNEYYWILFAYALTAFINITLLITVDKDNPEHRDYMPDNNFHSVKTAGYFHFIISIVFFMQYILGQGYINVLNGFSWLEDVQNDVIALPYFTTAGTAVFKIVSKFVPDAVWALIFVALDYKNFYYICFVTFSILGAFYNSAFFCFHVIDVAMRSKLLGYVMQSVFMNGDQVLVTLFLLFLLCWIYAVIGVYGFGFNQYSYGDSPNDYNWSPLLSNAFLQHLDFGIRSPPIFNSYAEFAGEKYLFDITYQVTCARVHD
jgi:hypothetical protein